MQGVLLIATERANEVAVECEVGSEAHSAVDGVGDWGVWAEDHAVRCIGRRADRSGGWTLGVIIIVLAWIRVGGLRNVNKVLHVDVVVGASVALRCCCRSREGAVLAQNRRKEGFCKPDGFIVAEEAEIAIEHRAQCGASSERALGHTVRRRTVHNDG